MVSKNRTGAWSIIDESTRGRHRSCLATRRAGAFFKDLIAMIEQFDHAHVGLRSVQENIDTTSIGGRLVSLIRCISRI